MQVMPLSAGKESDMESEQNKRMTKDAIIQELIALLNQSQQKEAANSVYEMAALIDGMEQKLDLVTEELLSVRKQLERMEQEKANKSLKAVLKKSVDSLEQQCHKMKEQLFEIKEEVREKASEIVAEVKKMPLQNILNVLPQAADVVITEGNLPDVKIRADKADDKWTLNIDGTIDGLKGSLINYPVTKGSGKFSADTEALKFAGLNLEVAGQTVIIDGNVYYAEKPEAKQTYALTVNAPSFVIEALSPGLGLKDAVTALGKVKGTIDKPEAEGTFGLDKLAYDPLYITALSGKFLYKDGKLNIGDAIGNVYAGQVNVNGQIDTKTKDFKLEVQGIDLDSSVVTETQVDGPLSFKMLAIGTADAGSATGAGSFRIEEGKYMMLPFRSIKGSITRQQGKFAFSNIKIATAVGSFDTNIIVKDNGKLGFDLDKGFLAAQLGEK